MERLPGPEYGWDTIAATVPPKDVFAEPENTDAYRIRERCGSAFLLSYRMAARREGSPHMEKPSHGLIQLQIRKQASDAVQLRVTSQLMSQKASLGAGLSSM